MNKTNLSLTEIHETVLEIQDRLSKNTRSEQSRINGAHSHGPTSKEGRLKCSKGALKHGLTARKHVVLDIEDDEEFAAARAAAIDEFRPNSAFRLNLVEELVKTRWRLDRIALLETAHLNRKIGLTIEGDEPELDALLDSWLGGVAAPLELLRRYSATLQHQYNATFAALHKLEARPRPKHETPYDETVPSTPPQTAPEPAAPPEFAALEDVK
jgi:hypothetical protein